MYFCMSCHVSGIIYATDQIKKAVKDSGRLIPSQLEIFEKLYVSDKKITSLINKDIQHYLKAVDEISADLLVGAKLQTQGTRSTANNSIAPGPVLFSLSTALIGLPFFFSGQSFQQTANLPGCVHRVRSDGKAARRLFPCHSLACRLFRPTFTTNFTLPFPFTFRRRTLP